MVLPDDAMERLRLLSNPELREIKLKTATAKIGTRDYELFRFVDRLLTEREGVKVPRREDHVRFEKF